MLYGYFAHFVRLFRTLCSAIPHTLFGNSVLLRKNTFREMIKEGLLYAKQKSLDICL